MNIKRRIEHFAQSILHSQVQPKFLCSCKLFNTDIFKFKRAFFILIIFCITFFYISSLLNSLRLDASLGDNDELPKCKDDHLFEIPDNIGSKQFIFEPEINNGHYLPFVGNGEFGVSFYPKPTLYLKDSRTLSLDTHWNPLILVKFDGLAKETFSTDTLTGTVSHYQCLSNGVFITSSYYAHRTHPHLFYQDVIINNPTDQEMKFEFIYDSPNWASTEKEIYSRSTDIELSGIVKNYTNQEILAVCLSVTKESQLIKVPPHRNNHFTFVTAIYKEKMSTSTYYSIHKPAFELTCKKLKMKASEIGSLAMKQEHLNAWQKLWNTRLSISHSKASGELNDDHINATLYYVLSNVLMNETSTSQKASTNITTSYISTTEGCYGGYHYTLRALGLWKKLNSYREIIEIVSLWLLTLEKQGCHKLLACGAEGVLQAMVLSFGAFRFSPHHLEFKIDPKVLHRDFHFRKIQLDYGTHLNVSVILQKDNKARIGASLDRNDKTYYACAGGCIEIIPLSAKEVYLPVKITEPITSILYITSDKNHMELIKDTLHVHKIVEAPAHDHHVVALHKHGSHLGGLPLMFWVTVIALIVVFHLFLCKLIISEYCGRQEKIKTRYARV